MYYYKFKREINDAAVLLFNRSRHDIELHCLLTGRMLIKGIMILVMNPRVLGVP